MVFLEWPHGSIFGITLENLEMMQLDGLAEIAGMPEISSSNLEKDGELIALIRSKLGGLQAAAGQ
jgi:hypothetical protein